MVFVQVCIHLDRSKESLLMFTNTNTGYLNKEWGVRCQPCPVTCLVIDVVWRIVKRAARKNEPMYKWNRGEKKGLFLAIITQSACSSLPQSRILHQKEGRLVFEIVGPLFWSHMLLLVPAKTFSTAKKLTYKISNSLAFRIWVLSKTPSIIRELNQLKTCNKSTWRGEI